MQTYFYNWISLAINCPLNRALTHTISNNMQQECCMKKQIYWMLVTKKTKTKQFTSSDILATVFAEVLLIHTL